MKIRLNEKEFYNIDFPDDEISVNELNGLVERLKRILSISKKDFLTYENESEDIPRFSRIPINYTREQLLKILESYKGLYSVNTELKGKKLNEILISLGLEKRNFNSISAVYSFISKVKIHLSKIDGNNNLNNDKTNNQQQ